MKKRTVSERIKKRLARFTKEIEAAHQDGKIPGTMKVWMVCSLNHYYEAGPDKEELHTCEHVPMLIFLDKRRAKGSAASFAGEAIIKEMELVL